MLVTPQLLMAQGSSEYSQAQVDALVNNLITTLTDFSAIACADGRYHRVLTGCDECGEELNWCLFKHILSGLFSASGLMRDITGFNPKPKYYQEIVPFQKRVKLKNPFLAEVNVALQEVYRDTISVNPVLTTISPVVQVDHNILQVPVEYITRSWDTYVFRDSVTNQIIEPESRYGFPRLNGNVIEWAVESGVTNDVNVFHCNLIRIEIPDEVYEAGRDYELVYTNTQQRVPVLQQTPNNKVFWVQVWELVDPAFLQSVVNITQGEYYKLLPTVDIRVTQQVTRLPSYVYATNCEDESPYAPMDGCQISVINAEYGVIELDFTHLSPPTRCKNEQPIGILINYYCDPTRLVYSANAYKSLFDRAISYFVAANLPTDVCNCAIREGFIKAAQVEFGALRVNPATGEVLQNIEYGNRYGHKVFAECVTQLPKYPQVFSF